jgi:hypothetical protein
MCSSWHLALLLKNTEGFSFGVELEDKKHGAGAAEIWEGLREVGRVAEEGGKLEIPRPLHPRRSAGLRSGRLDGGADEKPRGGQIRRARGRGGRVWRPGFSKFVRFSSRVKDSQPCYKPKIKKKVFVIRLHWYWSKLYSSCCFSV